MNRIRILGLALVLGFATAHAPAPAADQPTLKEILKGKVEEMNRALLKEEYGKVADLTHPKIVKMMGGREKMVAAMKLGTADMKSKGFSIRSVKVDDPSDPVAAGSDLFAVLPFVIEMTAPGGKILQKSFVIGVSSDEGKTWVFVNGDVDTKQVKQILPNLPDQLKRPEKQKPVFEKE
jgi:hypothetical protein